MSPNIEGKIKSPKQKSIKKSIVEDQNGKVTELDGLYNNKPFFRKYIKEQFAKDSNELQIYKLLKRNPHPNIIEIYNINDKQYPYYIDMELLESNLGSQDNIKQNAKQIYKHMKNALIHVHNLGIVFIDFQWGNIYYNKSNKKFVLFNFRNSGLFKKNKTGWIQDYNWINKPNSSKRFKEIQSDLPIILDMYYFNKIFFELS